MNNIAWLRKHNLDFYVEIPAVKIKTVLTERLFEVLTDTEY